ncbi:MAG: type IV toxin-antitoxin system AbiEi family antitoxin [Aestuariibacter sp.]
MSKLRTLSAKTVEAKRLGHCGIFTTHDLALLLDTPVTLNFRKFLSKATSNGVLKRIAGDLYFNPVAPPEGRGVLEKIALLLHWDKFIYVSLESQLSHLGRISQVIMHRLTVMTTGRSGSVETPFGTIEFTHTSRNLSSLVDSLYFDEDVGIFRAQEHKAVADLKRVGRNMHMLEN